MSMRIRVPLRAVLLLAMVAGSSPAFCATVTWDAGGGNNLWSDATNWNPNGLPDGGDDVVITNATSFDTVSLDQNATVKSIDIGNGAELEVEFGQVLTVNNASTVDNGGDVTLIGGTISGNGDLTVNGSIAVFGGTLGGSGELIINSGGQLSFGSSIVAVLSRTTTNAGTILFKSLLGTNPVNTTFNGATLTNTGTIDIQYDYDYNINPGLGSPVLNNNNGGVITKTGGNGIAAINFTVNNAAGATIETQSGDLELNGGGIFSGTYAISGSNVIRLGAGTFTMSGSPTATGLGDLIIDGATLDAGAGVDITFPNAGIFSGTVTGAGAVRVSGLFHWRGGTIAGSGPRVLNSTSTPTFFCNLGHCLLDGATLQLQASATFDPVNDLVFSNGASLTIDPGKTLEVINDGNVLSGGGAAGSIINNGTIWKTTTAGISTIGVPVTLSGTSTVDIDTGTLQFGGGASVDAGATLDIASGRSLEVTAGVFLVNSGIAMPGSGVFKVSGGALRVPTSITATIRNVTLQGSGVIDGAGAVHLSGIFGWRGGTIAGSGPRVLISTSSPTFSCDLGNCLLDGAALQLQDSGQYTANSNVLVFSNGASLILDPGQVLNVINDGDFSSGGGTASSIINNGTIRKQSTSGTSTIGVPVTLSGTSTVDIDAGTLQFGGGVTVAAGAILDIAASRTLEVTGGVFLFNSGTVSMPGSGIFKVSAGTLRVPTSITTTIPNVTLQGSGVIDGAGTLNLTGTSTWTAGTMGSATAPGGITQIDSGATLNVGPPAALAQNRILRNNGTLNLPATGGINGPSSTTIENNGTMAKNAGSGTIFISPRVENNNGATVSAAVGTIGLVGGGIAAGAHTISSGATLSFWSGTFTVATTATITGAGTFSVTFGAILDAGAGVDLTIPNLTLSTGGTLDGAGALRVSGNFTWSGDNSKITGSGPRVLNSTSVPTFTCSAGNCLLDGAALQLQASATYSASSNALVFSNGASLTIDSGKTLNITNDGDFTSGVGSGSIINNGTIRKQTTSGTSTIAVPLTLSGTSTVDIDTGTLQFGGGATVAAGATFDIAAGKILEVTGGVFLFNSGTVSTPGGGIFKVNSGTLRVPTGITLDLPNVLLRASGVIDGGGTLILSGAPSWQGGTMGSATAPGGITQINSGNTLNASGIDPQSLTDARQLLNNGTVNYSSSGAPNILTMSGNSRITNNGTLALPASSGINLSGSATIENNGTISKSAGFGTTTIHPRVENNNGATVSVATGTVILLGGGIAAGAYAISSGTTLTLAGGTFTVAGTATVTGAGTFTIDGATLDAGAGVDLTCPNVVLSSGTITGAGTVRVSGNFTWSGGTLAGSGPRVLDSTSTPLMECSTGHCNLDAATLQMNASGTFIATTNSLIFANAASLVIASGKTLDFTTDGTIVGSGTITNNGTITKSGGTGIRSIGTVLHNNGSVTVTSGGLSLLGNGTHGGSFTVTAPGAMLFDGGTHTISGGIGGTGNLIINGATVTLNSAGNVGGFDMSGGTLGGNGTLAMDNGGTWSGGTMSGSGTTINPATMSLGISAPVTLSRTLQNDGTLNVSGDITGSGTIANNGTIDAAGNITIGVTVNNNGQIATSGALSLDDGGTHTGSFTITTPGNLSFSSGTHSVSGGGSIGGSGTLTFSGATATVGVPINVGTLSVNAGTATLDANGSADAFTMTGGTLGGSGILTLTNGGTWSAGTMSGSGTTINAATMSFDISAPVTLSSRTLQNDGTLSVSGDITGSGTIANNGTLNPVGNITIGAALNNSGQIATGELLSLGGNGAHSGTFTTTATGVIDFSGGNQTISGTLAGTGTLRFSGAAATVSGTWTGMPIEVTGGSAALDSNGTIPALTLSGGTLTGSGDVTVSGPSTWSGGTLAGSGDVTFDTGATVTMPGTNPVTLARSLLNRGTINFTAVTNGMLIDGVRFRNNGTVDIQSSQGIAATAGTESFVNSGTLKKSSGSGVMLFGAPLSNSGLVQIESGTMQFGGTYAQSAGTTSILSGATLKTETLSLTGGSLTGKGTVVGTVANDATVSPGTSPGTLTVSGDYVQSADGTLEIELGGTTPGTQYDRLLVSGSVTLGGTLDVTTSSGFTPTPGNAFQIITFGSRIANSTFAFTNGLNGSGTALVPTFSAADLRLITSLEANLGVSVSAPPSVAQGSTFAYTVGVFNGGGGDANGVSVAATLPPNVTFTGASPAICSGAPNLVCSIGHLSNGSTATVVISVTADAVGAAPITVLTTASEPDSNVANNMASASPIITAAVADVAVGVTGPVSTIAGTTVIYTVTVSNSGPDTATNVAVTATASPGLTFSGNSGACVGSFPCNIGALSSGQHATIHSAWNVAPAATGSVQLTINANAAADANSSNDSDSASTNIGTCPAITIVAPTEMTTGLSAEATATAFGGATYRWSIVNGTIDSVNGTAAIEFTAGELGTTTLAVNVTGGGCSLSATFDVTVKPPCIGTATPTSPAGGTVTVNAAIDFGWSTVDDASGYRLWLQQEGAPARNLGTALGTSRTRTIPPGVYRWYVETLFDGCASHESERLALTVLPAEDCASREAPQLSAPGHESPATSAAVAFSWNAAPQALEYELWIAPAGGVPTLIRTTSDTSYTAVVPPGRLEWYVRAIFSGCASTESAHRTFTYTPPPECTRERPLFIAPIEGERLTSPVSFEWTSVSGATSYELYIDGMLAATTTAPHASGLPVPRAERRWQVRAFLGDGCGAVDSAESRLVVIARPPSCAPLGAPIVSAPAQISSGIAGRIQWSFVPGATAYEVEISGDPLFPRGATSSSTVTTRQLPFNFTNEGIAPVQRYVRVHAVDTDCVQPGRGAFSPVAELLVLPPAGSVTGREGVALLTDPTDVPYTLNIGAELAGQSFTATPTVPWISVTPASGIVPPGGQTLRAVAHSAGLPAGTSTGDVEIITTTAASAGGLTALATPPVKLTISLNNLTGLFTSSKSTPPPDALIIPAVASVKALFVRYDSDIRVTNTSAKVMSYEINFVPTGPAGMSAGQKTNATLQPGATMAMTDIVATWFGGQTSTGTLEIRPVTEIDTSTSSGPVGGLANRITFASSRTLSTTDAGGTIGQYIPAVPYANFIAMGSTLSLQHIAQSDQYRTNLGLVEGSGETVSLEVRIFEADGTQRASFPVDLNGGERKQLNSVLLEHGGALDDGRIEVEVTSGAGKVTAYASVIDNFTNDSQLVPPVTLGQAGHSRWVVPGVADLVSGWQTDVRIFNSGAEAAELTLEFYSMNGRPATKKTITLAAGEVWKFDHVLSFFAIAGDAGALHISSAAPAQVVATARTYKQAGDGAYGQFIAAVSPSEAVAVGTRPLQILQMEESPHFKSNIGLAEVSGKAVTLEVEVFRPNSNESKVLEVKLEPNQFLQLNSLIASLGLGDMYNARISVRAISGEGRALAYGSLIDHKTGDPTYIPGQ